MSEIQLPIVTEEDVLLGYKEIELEKRDGKRVKVTVKSLDWRTSVLAGELEQPFERTLAILRNCLNEEQVKDAFLNSIVPAHLHFITAVSAQLSSGVSAAKKRMSERTSQPSSPTTLPSSVS